MDLTKRPCCFCNTPCYQICWIGHIATPEYVATSACVCGKEQTA